MLIKSRTVNKFLIYLFSLFSIPLVTNQTLLHSQEFEIRYSPDVKFNDEIKSDQDLNKFEDYQQTEIDLAPTKKVDIPKKRKIKDSLNENKFIENKNYEYKTKYLLGNGDTISIDFYGLDNFSDIYLIDNEGNLTLPEINKFKAEGFTIDELKKRLEKVYEKYLLEPDITINIFKKRPITIFMSGEVKVPGLYKFDPKNEDITVGSKVPQSLPTVIATNKTFRLFEAIKLADGFTNYADLSNIKIVRKNSLSQGGGKITANLNFLKLFNEGDQTSNIELFDGDYIFINKSQNVIKEQLQAINKTNIGPRKMIVYVTGNVPRKGKIELPPGSSLLQAIASAGGKKFWTGSVEFLSFNYDGSSDKRVFKYDANARINSYKNPTLNNGDVINVRKTALGTTTDVLKEIKTPILSGYGLIKLFGY